MKNRLLTFIIFSFFTFSNQLFAQKNFQPGTVILLYGDSLAGEINYQEWKQSPLKISFRQTATGAISTYFPGDLKSFRVSGETYESAKVLVDKRSDYVSQLNDIAKIQTYPDSVFLRPLVKGDKALYYFNNATEHFYIRKEGAFELLRFKKYLENTSSGPVMHTNKEYVSQLSAYLSDCPKFTQQISRSSYSLKSLRQLFADYHACLGKDPVIVAKRDKTRAEFGLFAGASTTTPRYWSSTDPISKAKFTASKDFAAGLYLEYILSRNRSRVSIMNELMYSSYESHAAYTREFDYDVSKTYTYKVGFSYIKINNMARYKFLIPNGSIFLNGGISHGFKLKEVNSLTTRHQTFSSDRTQESAALYNTSDYELGYIAGAGAKRNRLGLELRMEKGNGMRPYSRMKTVVTRFFGLVSYQLF